MLTAVFLGVDRKVTLPYVLLTGVSSLPPKPAGTPECRLADSVLFDEDHTRLIEYVIFFIL